MAKNNKTQKQAKFFCENCGAEVAQNARFCGKCGRFFSSVRCPVCGKTGSSNMFANGCPSCGYGGKDQPGVAGMSAAAARMKRAADKKSHFYVHKKHSSAKKIGQPRGDGSLPVWIYAVTFAALALIIAGVVRCAL